MLVLDVGYSMLLLDGGRYKKGCGKGNDTTQHLA
jgi:hypothetical protein